MTAAANDEELITRGAPVDGALRRVGSDDPVAALGAQTSLAGGLAISM